MNKYINISMNMFKLLALGHTIKYSLRYEPATDITFCVIHLLVIFL